MRRSLPAESDLVHQVLVVPEQPLMIHLAVLPVTDRHHPDTNIALRSSMCFSLRFVTVGPSHDDVLSMTFLKTFPLLVAEHIEVERIKRFQILFDCR